MIHKLQKIFRSITKSLDIIYVMEGAKPCARILVHEDETKKIADFLEESQLGFSISDFKVLKQNQSDFYSDKSLKIQKNDSRKGRFIFYISKNEELCKKARLAEEKNNHVGLGLLLGYPKCCCEFFEKEFNAENADLTLKTLENSHGFEFPFYSNTAARHFDVNLLSHFPCSFNCEESIKIAKNNFKVVEKHSSQLARLFENILKSVVVYTSNEGIMLVKKYDKKGNEIIYSDVLATAKSKLYYLLSSNKKLQILNKNSFTVYGAKIEGKEYGIMVFF